MNIYYHVAPATYQDGDDLLCWDELEARDYDLTWKYKGEPVDTDVVCLFESEVEARGFIDTFLMDGRLLRVTLPSNADDVRMMRVQEGYPAVLRRIPACYVEAI